MKFMLQLMSPFLKSPAQGARNSLFLASSPEVEGLSGLYFVNGKPAKSKPISYDKSVAEKLWQASNVLVGLHA